MTAPISLDVARITGRAKASPGRFRNKLDSSPPRLGHAPSHLDSDQKRCWETFRREAPWLTGADAALVEIASRLRSRMMHDGWESSVAMLNLLRSCLTAMGCSPVGRNRVAPPAGADDGSPHFVE